VELRWNLEKRGETNVRRAFLLLLEIARFREKPCRVWVCKLAQIVAGVERC
jgi:hypothetical protein